MTDTSSLFESRRNPSGKLADPRPLMKVSALRPALIESVKIRALAVKQLESAGWESEDLLSRIQLRATWSGEGRAKLDDLAPLMESVASADISTQTGFRIGRAGDGLEVLSAPSALSDYYRGSQLEVAERIRDGDSGAVGLLEADWDASVTIDLARGLFDEPDSYPWKFVRSYDVLVETIGKLAWWELGSLIGSDRPLLVLILDDAPPRNLVTHSVVCCSESRHDAVDLNGVVTSRRQELVIARGEDPGSLVLPDEVIPHGPHEGVSDLVDLLRARAAAAAWGWLSNSIDPLGEFAELEFFGLQRVRAQLPIAGVPSMTGQVAALSLYRWATSEVSVDKILAVRQVVSIYAGSSFLDCADDVRRAAEPVYLALRRDAVSEALAITREARQIALSSTRVALESSLASAKSVGERALASLAALGALAITAATTENLSDSLVATITLGIGAFALFLAIWNCFVEGPISTFPLKNLRDQISGASLLLSANELDDLTRSTSVRRAWKRVLIIRILAPVIYIAVALFAATLAHPEPKGFWEWVGLR